MAEFASRGVGAAGLTTGIIGSALGVLNGGLGNMLGGNACGYGGVNAPVGWYELVQESKIAELQSQVALRDANIYNDQKLLEVYKYFDGKLEEVNGRLCQQAVVNAQITANIACMQQSLATLNGLTKTVIPIESICPEAMRRYNTWTAPTTPAEEAAGA